jgi:hypothetical protein
MAAPQFNPFPGLRSFEPDEEYLFFGREKQVDELLRRLRETRFLAVVGASGSGKSSLVRSGLIPALHSGYMVAAGSTWRVALMRPGSDPIGNLAAALEEREVVGAGPAFEGMRRPLVETTLRRSALGLAESVRYAHLPFADNVLVVVDQFEELFRFKGARRTADARDEAVAFVKLLIEASGQDMARVFVALTMRSEFIGQCAEFPGLAETINQGQYLVPRMTRDELRLAITGPIAVAGGEIAPRLVTRLLNDVGDDPDQLPVLQHALMRTWDHWAEHALGRRPVDLEDYEAIGTMGDALSMHADEAFEALPTDTHRGIAERLFKALIEMSPHAGGVRRPCRVDELCTIIDAPRDDVIAVIERFRMEGRSFLTPPSHVALDDSTIVDLSHESLIRLWKRLIGWTEEEGQSADIFERLSHAAALHDRGEAGLWRDPELQVAINWREARHPTPAWASRYAQNFDRAMAFLDESRAERDHAIAERRRFRKRRLMLAWTVAAVLLVLCVLSGVSLVFAMRNRNEAVRQRAQAEDEASKARAAERQALQQELKTRDALAQAGLERARAEFEKTNAEAAARAAEAGRLEAQLERRNAEIQRAEADRQRQAAIGERAVAEEATRTAEQARSAAEESSRAAKAAAAKAAAAEAAAASARDEQERLQYLSLARALAGDASGQFEPADVRVLIARQAYNLAAKYGGNPQSPDIAGALRIALEGLPDSRTPFFVGHNDAVRAVTLAPGGQLVTASDDGRVRIFTLADPSTAARVIGNAGSALRSLALDGKGALLAAGAFDGTIRVWTRTGDNAAPVKTWQAHTGPVSGLSFEPSGRLLSAGFDGRLHIWTAETFAPQTPALESPSSHRLLGIAVSPAGDRVAAASDGGGVVVWELAGGSPARILKGDARVSAVEFSPDGRRLAAGTAAGQLLLWNLAEPAAAPTIVAAHRAAVTAVRFAGGLVASGSLDGEVKVWRTQGLQSEQPLVFEHGAWVWAIAASAEGDRVFSAGADRRVRAWPVNARVLADEACRRVGRSLTDAEWKTHVSPLLPYAPTCPEVATRRAP